LIVGGVCALLGNAILIGFDFLHIHYAVSATVGFVVTLLVAYALHTKWTFEAERSFARLLRYGAAMAINLPLSMALLFMLVDVSALKMVIAAPLATILQTAFNYVVTARLMSPIPSR
jgi:putative flippase GtrA